MRQSNDVAFSSHLNHSLDAERFKDPKTPNSFFKFIYRCVKMKYNTNQWYLRLKEFVGVKEFCSADVPADLKWRNEMQELQEEGHVHRLGRKYHPAVKGPVVYWRLVL